MGYLLYTRVKTGAVRLLLANVRQWMGYVWGETNSKFGCKQPNTLIQRNQSAKSTREILLDVRGNVNGIFQIFVRCGRGMNRISSHKRLMYIAGDRGCG